MHDSVAYVFLIGRRSCLGEGLAKQEIFLFFTGLLAKFKFTITSEEEFPLRDEYQANGDGIIRYPPNFSVLVNPR